MKDFYDIFENDNGGGREARAISQKCMMMRRLRTSGLDSKQKLFLPTFSSVKVILFTGSIIMDG